MKTHQLRSPVIALAGVVLLAALGGCAPAATPAAAPARSSTPAASTPPATTPPASTPPASTPPAGTPSVGSSTVTALTTAAAGPGTIVVTGRGMSAYVFDQDPPGSGQSSCTGPCLTAWPAVTSPTATPAVTGLTAPVGTLTRADGTLQLTVAGRPVYTYALDHAPGDTTGQGYGGVWWLLAPDGSTVPGPNPAGTAPDAY